MSAEDRARERWDMRNAPARPDVAAYWLARMRARLRHEPFDEPPPDGQLSFPGSEDPG